MSRTSIRVATIAALVFVASIGIAARSPITFRTVAALTDAPLPAFGSGKAIDIASIVRAIPDRGPEGTADTVYAPHPAVRYQRSIVEGLGNCSNMVKGLSWKLLRDGYEFEIVYVLPIEAALSGGGHTILRGTFALPEGQRVGLVDLVAAAVPRTSGHVMDIDDFRGAVPEVFLDPLRPESEDFSGFYSPEFLHEVVIGRTSSTETADWFRVLDQMYIDLNLPEKLDKIFFVGIGVVLGLAPPIHVDDLALVQSRHAFEFAAMRAALWGMRVAPLILLGCGMFSLFESFRRRSGIVECRDLAGVGS